MSTGQNRKASEHVDRVAMAFTIRRFRSAREKFYIDLAEAIKDKEPTAKFLSIRLARAIKQKDPYGRLYKIFLDRLDQKGGSLSHMLGGIVPDSDLLVIASIETRGDVDEGLRFLAATIKSQRAMTAEMAAALLVPALVTTVCLGFIGMLSFFVIPLYATIVPPEKWNTMGKSIYAVSYVARHYGLLLLIAAAASMWWFKWSIPNWRGRRRAKVDNYIPYRVFRDYHGSIFMVALASLMVSGETLVRSLEKLKRRGKPWLRWHINTILNRLLTKNVSYGEAFATGIFGQELSNRLIDQSRRSSDFNQVIKKMGVEGIEEAREQVRKSAKSLNIALIFVLGALVAYLLLGTLYTGQGLSAGLRDSIRHQQVAKK
ncbi:type II secretion system F family protein [Burkholderia vietnamiensis]|uniref:type II secretion system F family protein n=1 Tax=Burkholderia vietnamiensis TaxID=60552 RepID=UPI001BA1DB14|nr:type II secretion system F family protein [Burkholderia vietnamiensis]MBR8085642.1 type II secretion system F family protein [Burkholderia vietnamiensis]